MVKKDYHKEAKDLIDYVLEKEGIKLHFKEGYIDSDLFKWERREAIWESVLYIRKRRKKRLQDPWNPENDKWISELDNLDEKIAEAERKYEGSKEMITQLNSNLETRLKSGREDLLSKVILFTLLTFAAYVTSYALISCLSGRLTNQEPAQYQQNINFPVNYHPLK